jgi:hypothetical protein
MKSAFQYVIKPEDKYLPFLCCVAEPHVPDTSDCELPRQTPVVATDSLSFAEFKAHRAIHIPRDKASIAKFAFMRRKLMLWSMFGLWE